jgi:hypothetical protein
MKTATSFLGLATQATVYSAPNKQDDLAAKLGVLANTL